MPGEMLDCRSHTGYGAASGYVNGEIDAKTTHLQEYCGLSLRIFIVIPAKAGIQTALPQVLRRLSPDIFVLKSTFLTKTLLCFKTKYIPLSGAIGGEP